MVEFLGYRFAFNAGDFEQRVTAAAVKLGLVEDNDLDEDETEDLVELAADGLIEEPRSSLGRYLSATGSSCPSFAASRSSTGCASSSSAAPGSTIA